MNNRAEIEQLRAQVQLALNKAGATGPSGGQGATGATGPAPTVQNLSNSNSTQQTISASVPTSVALLSNVNSTGSTQFKAIGTVTFHNNGGVLTTNQVQVYIDGSPVGQPQESTLTATETFGAITVQFAGGLGSGLHSFELRCEASGDVANVRVEIGQALLTILGIG